MSAIAAKTALPFTTISGRIAAVDWDRVNRELDAEGFGMIPDLFSPDECREIASLYKVKGIFRSQVIMARHGFGRGEYQYFDYPLPTVVADLRSVAYPHLVPIANGWNRLLGVDERFPETHAEFIERCHRSGQTRSTPLMLEYGEGDHNCLHQDLYGDQVFPLQLAVLLSEPGRDFTGGEFVMTEQRPRMQSRPMVLPLRRGDAVVFAVHRRPVKGTRGNYRVILRHGVSRVRSGHRQTLGIIFHDAK